MILYIPTCSLCLFPVHGAVVPNMGKTRTEIQAAYRERKRNKLGEKAFLDAESKRVKKYYGLHHQTTCGSPETRFYAI